MFKILVEKRSMQVNVLFNHILQTINKLINYLIQRLFIYFLIQTIIIPFKQRNISNWYPMKLIYFCL